MEPEIISQKEFEIRFCKWLIKNKRAFYFPEDEDIEDCGKLFRMPDFDYEHIHSMPDENGDLTTLLRCDYELFNWQTKNGKESAHFKFYCILKTYLDRVEDGPVVYGYSIFDE